MLLELELIRCSRHLGARPSICSLPTAVVPWDAQDRRGGAFQSVRNEQVRRDAVVGFDGVLDLPPQVARGLLLVEDRHLQRHGFGGVRTQQPRFRVFSLQVFPSALVAARHNKQNPHYYHQNREQGEHKVLGTGLDEFTEEHNPPEKGENDVQRCPDSHSFGQTEAGCPYKSADAAQSPNTAASKRKRAPSERSRLRAIATRASLENKSLNAWVQEVLQSALQSRPVRA
jgi:hypothetical protein